MIELLKQAAEQLQMQYLMLEVECEMPPQAESGPHGLNKGFDGHAIHQLCPAAPTDAALHRQRGYKIDALARRQPGAADQVVGFHPGSARHRARNSPGRAKQTLLRKNVRITSSMRKSMLDAERLGVEVVAGELMSALPTAAMPGASMPS